MIEWLWPWVFALLPLPWLVRRYLTALPSRTGALRVPDLAQFGDLSQHGHAARAHRRLRPALLWLAWLALLAAAARPQWTGEPVGLPTSGRDLMLAIDISGSMNTEDMVIEGQVVDRLTAVKTVAGDFIGRRQGDRIGLVLFGSNAYLQAPLTFDRVTVRALLDETPIGIAGGKTAIGDAIGLALKHLKDRPAESRVLVLLTDGANNVGEVAPDKAAELAATADVRIHTIGVGAESMRLPGFFRDRVVNPSADLDEDTLRGIAERTGGRYFRARDTEELEEIYRLIDGLEPAEQEARTFRPVRVLYYWPLGIGALLMAFVLLPVPGGRRAVA